MDDELDELDTEDDELADLDTEDEEVIDMEKELKKYGMAWFYKYIGIL
jgi:hypothetical protein